MFAKEDTAIIRELAKRVAEHAAHPRNEQLREMWREHTALRCKRPPVFVSPEGSWTEILPPLETKDPDAQALETELRQRLFRAECIHDDVPIENEIVVTKTYIPINIGWGMIPEREQSQDNRGAWKYKPVVHDPSDWKKLKKPDILLDEAVTAGKFESYQEALQSIMTVTLSGCKSFDFHLMHLYCDLRGLNELMLDLVDEPEMVHDVMSFFTEGSLELIQKIWDANLISLNNDAQFHYTGGLGYTDDLPAAGFNPERVRTGDVWAAAEAQELVLVSPEMHEEFALSYERKILENFGLNGYGCCEDLTHKLQYVKKIKNLRRIGICPWADLEKCAEQIGRDYIMTWKPNPAYLAGEHYSDEKIENYLSESLRKCKGAKVEIILRDTHTCHNDPSRFGRFVDSARRAINEVYGEKENFKGN
jgi:hypothetical protein